MRCFADEYFKYGGPQVDPNLLRLQFRLAFCTGFAGNLQYIEAEVLKEMPSKEEWRSVRDRCAGQRRAMGGSVNGVSSWRRPLNRWDPRVMGRWNVRCRTVAFLQLIRAHEALGMHSFFMEWVRQNPAVCRSPGV